MNFASSFLASAKFLIITLGTSRVYIHKKTKNVVSNCHKVKANEFVRKLLSLQEVKESLSTIIEMIKGINSNLQVIFTVSPVRHWKDGAEGNQISKSTLLLAINEVRNSYNNISYFPAYEVFMDELRDYRFYADDMLHPNETGIKYIWQRFSETYFDKETIEKSKEIDKVVKAISHRTFNKDSALSKEFNQTIENKIRELSLRYPEICFEKLKERF
jgi:hypothetical protein